jgi:hypothetical protein
MGIGVYVLRLTAVIPPTASDEVMVTVLTEESA